MYSNPEIVKNLKEFFFLVDLNREQNYFLRYYCFCVTFNHHKSSLLCNQMAAPAANY